MKLFGSGANRAALCTVFGAFGVFGALALAGCSSRPDQTEILVNTNPPGASCMLSRSGQPDVAVGPTPAIGIVPPVAGDISVMCRRPGFADATTILPLQSGGDQGSLEDPRHVDIALVPASR